MVHAGNWPRGLLPYNKEIEAACNVDGEEVHTVVLHTLCHKSGTAEGSPGYMLQLASVLLSTAAGLLVHERHYDFSRLQPDWMLKMLACAHFSDWGTGGQVPTQMLRLCAGD